MDPLFAKLAISSHMLRGGKLLKSRGKSTPMRLATLLKKMGATGPAAPSPITNTPGAGKVTAPSSKGLGGASYKLTPPPPVGGMQLQRNLFAKSQKPGEFHGNTTVGTMNPAGTSAQDLGLPPVVASLRIGRIDKLGADPAPLPPPPVPPVSGNLPPPPAPAVPNYIPPAPDVPTAPPPSTSTPSGFSDIPGGGGGQVWTPPTDWTTPRPWGDQSGWQKTKDIGLQALGGALNPFGMGTTGMLATAPLMMIPGVGAPLAVGMALGGAVWNPIKNYIDRTQGGTAIGQIRKDMPTTTGEAQNATGIESKEQFLERYGNDLPTAMADPVLRSLAVNFGIAPGGFSISNDINKGEWMEREGGGGEWSGEAAAWQQAMAEKAMQNPEQYPELAAALAQSQEGKTAALVVRNRIAFQRAMPKTASPIAAALRAAQRMQEKRADIACRLDRDAVQEILKKAGLEKQSFGLVGKGLLGLGLGAYGLGSAITPSAQEAPGVGGLGRFGLGLAGLYGGYKMADKVGLPGWLGAMVGAGVLPGLVGSVTSGGQGGLMGPGGLTGLTQNPLLTGALGYWLANKYPSIGNALPGGKWGGAALGALLGPSLMGGMGNMMGMGGGMRGPYG